MTFRSAFKSAIHYIAAASGDLCQNKMAITHQDKHHLSHIT